MVRSARVRRVALESLRTRRRAVLVAGAGSARVVHAMVHAVARLVGALRNALHVVTDVVRHAHHALRTRWNTGVQGRTAVRVLRRVHRAVRSIRRRRTVGVDAATGTFLVSGARAVSRHDHAAAGSPCACAAGGAAGRTARRTRLTTPTRRCGASPLEGSRVAAVLLAPRTPAAAATSAADVTSAPASRPSAAPADSSGSRGCGASGARGIGAGGSVCAGVAAGSGIVGVVAGFAFPAPEERARRQECGAHRVPTRARGTGRKRAKRRANRAHPGAAERALRFVKPEVP